MPDSARRPRLLRRLALLLAALALAGCSATEFAYNRLDTLVRWQLSRYVALDPAQRQRFDADFAHFWDWHRREELPVWRDRLRELAATADRQRSAAEYAALLDAYGDSVGRHFARLAPLACGLGPMLTSSQLVSLLDETEADLVELREETLDRAPEARRRDSRRDLEKSLKRLVGPLSDAQRALLSAQLDRQPAVDADWYAYRLRWRDAFAAVLDRRGDAEFCKRITDLFTGRRALASTGEQQRFAANRESWGVLLAAFDASLSDRQRGTARERLDAFARTLEGLIAPPG